MASWKENVLKSDKFGAEVGLRAMLWVEEDEDEAHVSGMTGEQNRSIHSAQHTRPIQK